MNYLSFQPAFDVFHTEFRFLRLRRIMSAGAPWHYDQLRIADFYLLFFFRIQSVRLSPKHRSYKKLAREQNEQRYEMQPDDQLIFDRMEGIQRAAIDTLVANDFFEKETFKSEMVIETQRLEPEVLSKRIDSINSKESRILEVIQSLVSEYSLLGPEGIKARTGLLEYRYDAI